MVPTGITVLKKKIVVLLHKPRLSSQENNLKARLIWEQYHNDKSKPKCCLFLFKVSDIHRLLTRVAHTDFWCDYHLPRLRKSPIINVLFYMRKHYVVTGSQFFVSLSFIDSSITCVSSEGTLSLSRCQVFEAGFHPGALHLLEDSCNGTIQDGRLVFHFNNDDQLCGTVLRVHVHTFHCQGLQSILDASYCMNN